MPSKASDRVDQRRDIDGRAWVPAALYDRAVEARDLVHAHVQTIRGMCTDELDHREIDRALVQLDEAVCDA